MDGPLRPPVPLWTSANDKKGKNPQKAGKKCLTKPYDSDKIEKHV